MPENVKIDLNLTLPFLSTFEKGADVYIRIRETMKPEIRDRWDQIFLEDYEVLRNGWRKLVGLDK